jgi:RHS repeat-associated protein
LYDGNEVIAEYNASGSLTHRFMYGAGVDNPIALKTNGQTYYYHTDEIGSVVALSNSANQLEEQYSYGPFGQSNDIGHVGNPLRYTARRLDSETGRYYYRARYYEPQWGKFLQADPLGYADGMNAYAYVGHDPVNLVDPYGTTATRGGYSSSAGSVSTGSSAFDLGSGWAGLGSVNASQPDFIRFGSGSDAITPSIGPADIVLGAVSIVRGVAAGVASLGSRSTVQFGNNANQTSFKLPDGTFNIGRIHGAP